MLAVAIMCLVHKDTWREALVDKSGYTLPDTLRRVIDDVSDMALAVWLKEILHRADLSNICSLK